MILFTYHMHRMYMYIRVHHHHWRLPDLNMAMSGSAMKQRYMPTMYFNTLYECLRVATAISFL